MNQDKLEKNLDRLTIFLTKYKVKTWPERIKQARLNLTSSPIEALEQVKQMFRGAGTLDDLVISKSNGHLVDNERAANEQLDEIIKGIKQIIEKANYN